MSDAAHRAAEAAARNSYGRLVALLATRSRDVAAAEDALSDALRQALTTWPERGVPDQPEAWLLTVARRLLSNDRRSARVRDLATVTLEALASERLDGADATPGMVAALPDERLALMFVCAHPAIDPAARTPLMLQTVLGIDAARIASAFLVTPASMSQRLVRAKSKIRDAGIRFAIPEPKDLPARLDAVMEAIYAAFGSGWEEAPGVDQRGRDLTEETIWLARVLAGLLPRAAEARGLLALMLHSEARRPARRSPSGAFVPLGEQDRTCWSAEMIEEAEQELAAAAKLGAIGRFQIEAAIQSAHNAPGGDPRQRAAAVVTLYDALVSLHPTLGAWVGRAAALAVSGGDASGLAALAALDADAIRSYQPYWALRAHLLARLDRREEAGVAYDKAIGLSEDQAVRAFLIGKRALLG